MDEETKEETNDLVIIESSDGELFEVPVSIANKIGVVRQHLQKEGNQKEEHLKVDVECNDLDTAIQFLECEDNENELHNRNFMWNFPNRLDEMLAAARTLDIPALEAFTLKIKSKFDHIRYYSWDEFIKHQKLTDFWVLIGGCIYDITKWINPHPGTQQIPHPGGKVPLQGARRDSSYFFEIYHHTNDAYRLLKYFFIGKLKEEDKDKVPPLQHLPSPSFLHYLHSFTHSYAGNTTNSSGNTAHSDSSKSDSK